MVRIEEERTAETVRAEDNKEKVTLKRPPKEKEINTLSNVLRSKVLFSVILIFVQLISHEEN